MSLAPLQPTDTRPFFRPLAAELVAVLRELPPDAWNAPTVAGTWRVRDVVAHLVDVGLRRLSFHRDGHTPPAPGTPPRNEREFVAFINGLNRQWVEAAERVSPPMLVELSALVGTALADFVERFPDDGPALFPVSWAGEAAVGRLVRSGPRVHRAVAPPGADSRGGRARHRFATRRGCTRCWRSRCAAFPTPTATLTPSPARR